MFEDLLPYAKYLRPYIDDLLPYIGILLPVGYFLSYIYILFIYFPIYAIAYYLFHYYKFPSLTSKPNILVLIKYLDFLFHPVLACLVIIGNMTPRMAQDLGNLFYVFVLSFNPISLISSYPYVVIFLVQIGMTYFFFKVDKKRHKEILSSLKYKEGSSVSPKVSFRGQNLLYQFGEQYNNINFPIKFDIDKLDGETDKFIKKAQIHLRDTLKKSLDSAELIEENICIINLSDKEFPRQFPKKVDKDELSNRNFLHIPFETYRETNLNYFIYFKKVGKSIVAHFSAYRQAKYTSVDLFAFILTAPFHFWIWIWAWYKGEYSITSKLKSIRFSNNAFNDIDAVSIDKSVYDLLLHEMKTFLKENDLLTEQLENSINQFIENVNITNNNAEKLYNINKITNASFS